MGLLAQRIQTHDRIMAAPKGNQFWKARSSHGANPTFDDPEKLWDACQQYFKWVADNPLQAAELVKFQGKYKTANLPKMRAMTIGGLCLFVGICQKTWQNYRERVDLLPITTRVDEIIRQQKFEGAAAELLNANIIARDLGLSDKKELFGKDGGPIEYADVTDEELDRKIKTLMTENGTNDHSS